MAKKKNPEKCFYLENGDFLQFVSIKRDNKLEGCKIVTVGKKRIKEKYESKSERKKHCVLLRIWWIHKNFQCTIVVQICLFQKIIINVFDGWKQTTFSKQIYWNK